MDKKSKKRAYYLKSKKIKVLSTVHEVLLQELFYFFNNFFKFILLKANG